MPGRPIAKVAPMVKGSISVKQAKVNIAQLFEHLSLPRLQKKQQELHRQPPLAPESRLHNLLFKHSFKAPKGEAIAETRKDAPKPKVGCSIL